MGRREELQLVTLRQTYLTRKMQQGQTKRLMELKIVLFGINECYAAIKFQARVQEVQEAEQIHIYHIEIHQNKIKKSSILKLQIEEGILEGHQACSTILEKMVA